jgi:hypothetical protein
LALFFGELESLLEKKQFAEAVQCIDQSGEEEAIRQNLKRSVLRMQYMETHDDSIVGQIIETYTSQEKMTAVELNESAKQAVAIPDVAERMDVFLEILQEQFRFMDIAGARQTMKLVSEQLDKETDPVRIIQYRLLLARLQAEVREKNSEKENLGKLMQTLSAVKDLTTLKDLVPEQPTAAEKEPTDTESAIRNQLFQVYLLSASLFARADAQAESKAAFDKAKELAKVEPVAAQKAEKFLILAQFLAEAE